MKSLRHSSATLALTCLLTVLGSTFSLSGAELTLEGVLSLPESGRYRLRLACAGFDNGRGKGYTLRAVSDVPRPLYFVLAVLGLLLLPAVVSIGAVLFESRRWSASAHPWGEEE